MDTSSSSKPMMELNDNEMMINDEEDSTDSAAVSSSGKATSDEAPTTTTRTTKQRRRMSKVPISRVSVIMRSCPNLTTVKNDAVALTSHAAELFVKELVTRSIEIADNPNHLTYNDLSAYIANLNVNFLKDVVPQKITARQYYHIKDELEAQAQEDDQDGSETD